MYRSDLIWFNVCICIIQDRKCQIINDMIHSKIPIVQDFDWGCDCQIINDRIMGENYTQSESWDGSQIPSAKKKKNHQCTTYFINIYY
jgi:hypothetical protein